MMGLRQDKKNIDLKNLNRKDFDREVILNKLNEYLCEHIDKQFEAGSDVVQIFDSWAGLIPPDDLNNFCYIPNLKIVDFCKRKRIFKQK